MKFLTATLLTALLAFVAGLYMDWWSVAIAAFLIALLVHQRSGKAFLSGALGVFLLWLIIAIWIDSKNDSLLSKKIAVIVHMGSPLVLILVTAIVGALVAGCAALSGSYLRSSR
jgi:hypothetical protein